MQNFVFFTDDWQPLPLVTMTEESELALRDKSFQKLLKKIGLAPPSNEQVQILMLCTVVYCNCVLLFT
jgi:hypothetical protein